MNKKEAEKIFKMEYLPNLNKKDKILIKLEWNCFVDQLCKEGEITLKQYEKWSYPSFCK